MTQTGTRSAEQPCGRQHLPNRWLIAGVGMSLQLCLGTVYAWSFFQKPLMDGYCWSNAQVALAFSIAIGFLGAAAAWGGANLARYGPRRLAMLGGALFGGGYLLAALALQLKSLWLLYLGYGVVGGIGLGLGYVTPVATAAKWFPDRKGLVTGMVVMGFGFGALLMSKVLAPALVNLSCSPASPAGNYGIVFACLGGVFLAITLPVASLLRNPPAGYLPPGYRPAEGASGGGGPTGKPDDPPAPSVGECLVSRRFALMWVVFFCNITAGIALISFQSPLLQDLWKKTDASLSKEALAACGATLIAVSSLFNGIGRLFWGGLSDRIGRVQSFRLMLATQVVAFGILIVVGDPWLFGALVCYVLLCYGGGFGTMPSFVQEVFGTKMMANVYGVILTAWSAAGIVGPQVVAFFKDKFPAEKFPGAAAMYSCEVGAGLLAAGLLISFFLSNRPFSPRRK